MRAVLEVLEGVAPFLETELATTVPGAELLASEPTEVRVEVEDPSELLKLRTAVAAYVTVDLDIRRPRALLSPEHLRTCVEATALAKRTARPARFGSFRLSAAGSDSPELERFRAELGRQTGLRDDPTAGDMLLRLRHAPEGDPARAPGSSGTPWQLLVRLTPRPLSARPWRVVNYPGALNATVAAAVVATTNPTPEDSFLDLMCGSGTLVIERLAQGRPDQLVAVDSSAAALEAARANQRAAKFRGKVDFLHADTRELAAALAGGSPASPSSHPFDRLVVNLPWGELVGDHAANEELYTAVLREAALVASDDVVLCVLTHDIRRFERCLAADATWAVDATWRFFQKGHRPKLYRLVRATA